MRSPPRIVELGKRLPNRFQSFDPATSRGFYPPLKIRIVPILKTQIGSQYILWQYAQ